MALGVKLMGAFPVNAPETMARLQASARPH
jgi:hypothetical protein